MRIVFQPMIDLSNGQVVGAEALIRWDHPVRGEVSPAEFIPDRRTCRSHRTDRRVGAERELPPRGRLGSAVVERFVSVNVSAHQIRQTEFVTQVRDALRRHGLDPSLVMLEITETMFVEEVESASGNLEELRALGIRIAIDDFGTGYCSLSYLQRFPVDVVKIDRRFVEELGEGQKSSTLAKMILQMTSALGVISVAEGIERPAQLNELRRSVVTSARATCWHVRWKRSTWDAVSASPT